MLFICVNYTYLLSELVGWMAVLKGQREQGASSSCGCDWHETWRSGRRGYLSQQLDCTAKMAAWVIRHHRKKGAQSDAAQIRLTLRQQACRLRRVWLTGVKRVDYGEVVGDRWLILRNCDHRHMHHAWHVPTWCMCVSHCSEHGYTWMCVGQSLKHAGTNQRFKCCL